MKRTLTISLFLLATFVSYAQDKADQCAEITPVAPDSVRPGESFEVHSALDRMKRKPFDWIVLKNNDNGDLVSTLRFFDKSSFSIGTNRDDDFRKLTIVAVPKEAQCERVSVTTVFISSGVFDPHYIDYFDLTNWNEAYFRLDNAQIMTENSADDRLFIFVEFPQRMKSRSPRYVLDRIFDRLSKIRKMKLEDFAFVVRSGTEKINIRFQPVPKKYDNIFLKDGDIIIHGENYATKRSLLR